MKKYENYKKPVEQAIKDLEEDIANGERNIAELTAKKESLLS